VTENPEKNTSSKVTCPTYGNDQAAFGSWLLEVKSAVETRLGEVLDACVAHAGCHGGDVGAMVEAARSLALRGGKRFRAALLAAAYVACGGTNVSDVVSAGVGLELLQTYFLVHDDWMDEDEVRRGGPTVHVLLAERFGGQRIGDMSAILAGDFLVAASLRALLDTTCRPNAVLAASREFARMQEDVVFGQLLDIRGAARSMADVEAMHALKTGSYTVRGPLLMGACLAEASSAQRDGLGRFAAPLGVAFQLRDDLLGAFGDSSVTGKPVGNDFRQGKRTALIAELAADADALVERVLGRADASSADIEALLVRLVESGARARVERRLADLVDEAAAGLDGIEFTSRGRTLLRGAASLLVV
jgi:geranylgeranyl diphosphate synthase type I